MNKVFTTDKYSVQMREGTVCKTIPVYISLQSDGTPNAVKLPEDVSREYNGLGLGVRTIKTYFTSFTFETNAKCKIRLPKDTEEVIIKPHMPDFSYKLENRVLSFNTDKTRCFVIEPNGSVFGGIHVFCNQKKTYCTSGAQTVIELNDGVYTADNCAYIHINAEGTPIIDNLPDNTILHIGEGAVLNAAIELIGRKNIKIVGTGTISLIDRCHGAQNDFADERMWGAFRYNAKPNILIRSGCENIEIDGVLLNCEFRGIVIRNSEKISIKNVKMFTSAENADGINCYNTSGLIVDSCYIQSADDCFCMYNSCDSISTLFDAGYKAVKAVCRDVEVKNCILCSGARPVVLGGHATGSLEPRCLIENIYLHDCVVTETPNRIYGNEREHSVYWSGFLRLLSQSEQLVKNIRFENIDVCVTKGHSGKPVHIEVRGSQNASYTENQGYRIENITFKNIAIRGHIDKLIPSLIRCRQSYSEKDNCGISNIRFENFTIGGRRISQSDIFTEGNCTQIDIL